MNAQRQVLITDAAGVLGPAIAALENAGVTVHVLPDDVTHADAMARARDVPVLLVGFMPFGREEFSQLDSLELIVRAGIGYDMVDVDAATAAGVWVANVPDFCVDEVADHTLLLLLATVRRLPDGMNTWRRARSWYVTSQLPPISRIRGKRLGVIGLGRIGRSVATRARACGWDVIGHDPLLTPADYEAIGIASASLTELLECADAITLHCPLTAENEHLINQTTLELMQDGAIIVNTSRGGLIDLDALDEALASGKVASAALDVLDGEPTPDLDHPILARPNLLVTSHMAWYSEEAKRELATNAAAEAIRHLDGGRPRNLLNPDARPAQRAPDNGAPR